MNKKEIVNTILDNFIIEPGVADIIANEMIREYSIDDAGIDEVIELADIILVSISE